MRFRIRPAIRNSKSGYGFTLIELLIVVAIMAISLTFAMPRLSIFLAGPDDRELRNMEHFVLRSGRRAVREPLVLLDQLDAKPLRLKIVPPQDLALLRGDTELAHFQLSLFRIDEIVQDGIEMPLEPEFAFSPLGLVPPFSIKMSQPAPGSKQIEWKIDRMGAIRVSPVL